MSFGDSGFVCLTPQFDQPGYIQNAVRAWYNSKLEGSSGPVTEHNHYWNTVASPIEFAAKRAIEKREEEQKTARTNAEAANENAAKIARSQAAANLKSSVVSTSSEPTEDEMKRRVEQLIRINSQGMIRLVGFKKRDGMDAERGGVKFYSMEWTAMLEITKDCLWKNATFEAVPPTNSLDGILYTSSGFQPAKQGQRIDLNSQTTFRRTENGWRE